MNSSSADELVRRCAYVVPRKKRKCRMMVKGRNEFCGEHAAVSGKDDSCDSEVDRMLCPYDPKHTCSKRRLQRHLKACAARPKPMPEYHAKGLNSGDDEGKTGVVTTTARTINDIPDECLAALVKRVNAVFEQLAPLPAEHLAHPAVREDEAEVGAAARRHLTQNSSLVRHMEAAGLSAKPAIFVEFGSGRGQLTYWLTKALDREEEGDSIGKRSEFVLVDRGSQRHKMDNKLKNEFQDNELSTTRIRIDIADLALANVPCVKSAATAAGDEERQSPVVALSKHLCGCATDLALRCLANAGGPVDGLCVACCCHHRCEWVSYVAKEFLTDECGFDPDDFFWLTRMTTWATCGSGRPRKRQDSKTAEEGSEPAIHNTEDASPKEQEVAGNRYARLGLDDASYRAEIGWRVKRILDEGRVRYAKGVLGLKRARLVHYCPKDVSPENVLLIASK